MPAMSRTVAGTLRNWMARLRGNGLAVSALADDPPLRAELLSADQMKQHGRTLATAHELAQRWAPDRLLARLAENEKVLIDACKLLTEALAADRRIVPAGEWLLDNFYLIEEQIRTARRHLPEGYSRELPRLRSGPSRIFRGCTTSRWRRSRTEMDGWMWRAWLASWRPTRR